MCHCRSKGDDRRSRQILTLTRHMTPLGGALGAFARINDILTPDFINRFSADHDRVVTGESRGLHTALGGA